MDTMTMMQKIKADADEAREARSYTLTSNNTNTIKIDGYIGAAIVFAAVCAGIYMLVAAFKKIRP